MIMSFGFRVAIAAVLMTIGCWLSVSAGTLDSNAVYDQVGKITASVQFHPVIVYGSVYLSRFGVPAPADAEIEQVKEEATRLYGRLKSRQYRILTPTEEGAGPADLAIYRSLKPACLSKPILLWDNGRHRVLRDSLTPKARPDGLPSGIVPYAPGTPRPIDYDLAYQDSFFIPAFATNLALYVVNRPEGASASAGTYVLKAEDFRMPGAPPARVSPSVPPGTMVAFDFPSCTFLGSIDYFNFCASARKPDKKAYVAEVIKVDDRPYVLVINSRGCPGDQSTSYRIEFWDLGLSNRLGGRVYALMSD